MHANFAVIYMVVPVLGLAYSCDIAGSFNYYGLNDSSAKVIDLYQNEILVIIELIIPNYPQKNKTKDSLEKII
jgi:hypothetical protein